MTHRLLVVTPAKDEAGDLPDVIEAVVRQSKRPAVWVIVDDGSEDETPAIAKAAAASHDWILYHRRQPGGRDLFGRYADVVGDGLTVAIDAARERSIAWTHLGILDADIIPSEQYWATVLDFMAQDANRGVYGGQIFIPDADKWRLETAETHRPRGGNRVFTRACHEAIGGWPRTAAPDTVQDIKAESTGYQIGIVPDAPCRQTRPTNTASGRFQGALNTGKTRHYLGYRPLNVVVEALRAGRGDPRVLVGSTLGYWRARRQRVPQVPEPVVHEHFAKWRLRHALVRAWKGRRGGQRPQTS